MGIVDLEKKKAVDSGTYDSNPNCPDCGNKLYQNDLEVKRDRWWCHECQRYAAKRVTVRGYQHITYLTRGEMASYPPKNARKRHRATVRPKV